MNVRLCRENGYWHMLVNNDAKIRTPYPDKADRGKVTDYVHRRFPDSKVFDE